MKMMTRRRNRKNARTTENSKPRIIRNRSIVPASVERTTERGEEGRGVVFEGGAERYRKENRAMSQPPNQAADC